MEETVQHAMHGFGQHAPFVYSADNPQFVPPPVLDQLHLIADVEPPPPDVPPPSGANGTAPQQQQQQQKLPSPPWQQQQQEPPPPPALAAGEGYPLGPPGSADANAPPPPPPNTGTRLPQPLSYESLLSQAGSSGMLYAPASNKALAGKALTDKAGGRTSPGGGMAGADGAPASKSEREAGLPRPASTPALAGTEKVRALLEAPYTPGSPSKLPPASYGHSQSVGSLSPTRKGYAPTSAHDARGRTRAVRCRLLLLMLTCCRSTASQPALSLGAGRGL